MMEPGGIGLGRLGKECCRLRDDLSDLSGRLGRTDLEGVEEGRASCCEGRVLLGLEGKEVPLHSTLSGG